MQLACQLWMEKWRVSSKSLFLPRKQTYWQVTGDQNFIAPQMATAAPAHSRLAGVISQRDMTIHQEGPSRHGLDCAETFARLLDEHAIKYNVLCTPLGGFAFFFEKNNLQAWQVCADDAYYENCPVEIDETSAGGPECRDIDCLVFGDVWRVRCGEYLEGHLAIRLHGQAEQMISVIKARL